MQWYLGMYLLRRDLFCAMKKKVSRFLIMKHDCLNVSSNMLLLQMARLLFDQVLVFVTCPVVIHLGLFTQTKSESKWWRNDTFMQI